MSGLTIIERARVLGLAARMARRKALAAMLASPLLRWRYGAPAADALTMVPHDLRPADASFADEVAQGHFGLADTLAHIRQGSPFDFEAPSPAWARALHGFSWLRHLRAAASEAATHKAQALVAEWIGYGEARHPEAWEPAVAGRRIVCWLGSAGMILENVDQATFDRTAQSLADQLVRLSGGWRAAREGYPRLEALIGVVYGDICIAGHERHLLVSEAHLGAELARQIMPDGGHISRNTGVLVELMLDLLPLRQCYATLKRKLPGEIEAAMSRMWPLLRFMRLGDGSLARFNSVGATPVAELATVLAYDSHQQAPLAEAPQSRYARVAKGGLVLIADVGTPPRLELAGQAFAGALSFELSAGRCAIFVNGGAPGPSDQAHLAAARATACHNTLGLGDTSSARLLRHARLERLIGGVAVRGPDRVASQLEPGEAGTVLEMSHNGYSSAHGLIHTRRLSMSADGARLEGGDRLGGRRRAVRLARDVPFVIRFHLHPHAGCEVDRGGAALINLRDGARWRFAASGAELSVEPGLHYADPAGTVRTRQIVLRGACWGETSVDWCLEQAG